MRYFFTEKSPKRTKIIPKDIIQSYCVYSSPYQSGASPDITLPESVLELSGYSTYIPGEERKYISDHTWFERCSKTHIKFYFPTHIDSDLIPIELGFITEVCNLRHYL